MVTVTQFWTDLKPRLWQSFGTTADWTWKYGEDQNQVRHTSGLDRCLLGAFLEHLGRLARALPTVDNVNVDFKEIWARRLTIALAPGIAIQLPIDDLILTKRFANRPKDLEDIRLLTILKGERR
jgi:hypothetical protein